MGLYDTVIFIDNGSTGSIGVISRKGSHFFLTPAYKTQDYTKKKKTISRLNVDEFSKIISQQYCNGNERKKIFLERPMINSQMFNASIVAARVFEAQLTIIEMFGLPYEILDSKQWQSDLLPSSRKKGTTSAMLKKESMDIGIRLFPEHKILIEKHKDADGLLGAYAMYKKEGI